LTLHIAHYVGLTHCHRSEENLLISISQLFVCVMPQRNPQSVETVKGKQLALPFARWLWKDFLRTQT